MIWNLLFDTDWSRRVRLQTTGERTGSKTQLARAEIGKRRSDKRDRAKIADGVQQSSRPDIHCCELCDF
jgi:hypothetical protein